MQARFEKWLGELTEEQVAAIRVWSYGATKRTAGWVKSRLVWQQALHDVLSRKQERKKFENSLFVLLRYPKRLWTESHKWEREMGRREIKKLLYAIYLTLLPRQNKHLLQQLDSWSDDIDSLSCEGERKSARRDAEPIDISLI